MSTLGFIYLNCTARQVQAVHSHADSSPIRLQLILVSQVSSAPVCGFQVMKCSEYSEALLKGKRKTGIYSDATGGNTIQSVDKHWSDTMSNAVSYVFWRKQLSLMIFRNWHIATSTC